MRNRKPNEVPVTYITYLPFKDKFLYLSVAQAIYNNEIVVWKLSHSNDLQLVLKTLDLATQKRDVYMEPSSTQIEDSDIYLMLITVRFNS